MADTSGQSRFSAVAAQVKAYVNGGLRLSVILFLGVIAWRIAWSDVSLDLSKFDFSDLLAMILALFAIAMSVAFYFKTTDSSNQFYDNIYNFTQKTSEILGRIEERFGERLRHLDEGYGRIQSQVEGISRSPGELAEHVKETEGKEEKEKEKLEEANKAMEQMVDELVQRAELQNQEKEEFYNRMNLLAIERDQARERLREIEADRDQMKHELALMQESVPEEAPELRDPYLMDALTASGPRNIAQDNPPSRVLRRRVRGQVVVMTDTMLRRLQSIGLLDSDRELSPAGALMLRSVSRGNR